MLAVARLRALLTALADRLVPPEVVLLERTTAVAATQIAAAVAELGIADALAGTSMTATQIAERVGVDPEATHRLLRAAAGYGLCRMNRDTGAVRLTRTGDLLRSGHPKSLQDWAGFWHLPATAAAWAHLTQSVRSGQPAFSAAHGISVWEWFSSHPGDGAKFAKAMRQISELNANVIADAYPWPATGVVCDVAGGVGVLLAAVLTRRPALRGVLIDTPAVIDDAATYLAARGVTERIGRVDGDLFGPLEARADVYILKSILHDWDDERCRLILAAVAAAMPVSSRLLVIEVLQEHNSPHRLAPFLDLTMLTQTDGGRQRSIEELSALLSTAGLQVTGVVGHAAPLDLIEAVKVDAGGATSD